MVRVIAIGRPPYEPSLIEVLRGGGPVFHPDPSLEGFAALKAAGVDVLPLPPELPDDATLLHPSATGQAERLVQIVDRLLGPGGCPWDQAQTHASLKPYLIEEAYEVCEAIDQRNMVALIEELGDVFLQPVLHAQMEARDGGDTFDTVAQGISDKLVRRHPHVFGDVIAGDAATVLKNWDAIKKSEKASTSEATSILAGIPTAMPSLLRALETSKRASRQGFEWPDVAAVWAKVREEESEFAEATAQADHQRMEEEFGDLLFTLVNVARWHKINPEEALRLMVDRFAKRFKAMESMSEVPLGELSADDWEELWQKAKTLTKSG